tara:strand:- start:1557 stop:2123 length:567 start_codon:yes stop_codon:yes gene_type:complete
MMPTPASTVVVARQGLEDIEVLLLLRSAALKFNGDCWVFPGGRIDPQDYPDTQRQQEFQAAQRAAVRETQEEAGLDISGTPLLHIAHWTTPEGMSRRFSTWFFLCVIPAPAPVQVDAQEILAHRWLSPRAALALHRAGECKLPEPTLQTLKGFTAFRDLSGLVEGVAALPIHVFPKDSPFYRLETIEY